MKLSLRRREEPEDRVEPISRLAQLVTHVAKGALDETLPMREEASGGGGGGGGGRG